MFEYELYRYLEIVDYDLGFGVQLSDTGGSLYQLDTGQAILRINTFLVIYSSSTKFEPDYVIQHVACSSNVLR